MHYGGDGRRHYGGNIIMAANPNGIFFFLALPDLALNFFRREFLNR